jgi:hypothetical protein
MIEAIKDIINYLGASNSLTILFFLISVFIGFYFYYKTFFRLTYSIGRICKNCNNISDWTNNENEFITRILFYNNGRKTITTNDIHKLELISKGNINSVKIIKGNDNIKITINACKTNIEIDYIDSSEFFVLEVNHNGLLDVNGRISETGNLLHAEPKYWIAINIAFMIFFFVITFYNLSFLKNENETDILKKVTNLFIFFGMFSVIRFIHSILFIPDSVTSKYLDTKDKFAKDFNN